MTLTSGGSGLVIVRVTRFVVMVEETTPRRRQAFSDENLYLEPVLAPLLRRVSRALCRSVNFETLRNLVKSI